METQFLPLAQSSKEQPEAPKDNRKRRFQFTIRQLLIATALLAGVLGVSRWIYLARPWAGPSDDTTVVVTLCEKGSKSMLLELRMRESFKVVLKHCLERRTDLPNGPGGHAVNPGVYVVNVETVRSEAAAIIPSEYDVLRGNFVQFRVSNGKQITVQANNKTIWIAPWTVADASNTNWEGLAGLTLGDSRGITFGELAACEDEEEVIRLYAGTATGY